MTLSAERIKQIEELIANTKSASFGFNSVSCEVFDGLRLIFFYQRDLNCISYIAKFGVTREELSPLFYFCAASHALEGSYVGKYNPKTINSLLSALVAFSLITYEERTSFIEYLESEDQKIRIELNNNFNRLEQEAKKFGFKLSK